ALHLYAFFFFFQAEDGIRDWSVTGVQTCALPIYLAKNVVAAGLADRCTIQLSYAIGVAKPLSIYVDLGENPNKLDIAKLEAVLRSEERRVGKGSRSRWAQDHGKKKR